MSKFNVNDVVYMYDISESNYKELVHYRYFLEARTVVDIVKYHSGKTYYILSGTPIQQNITEDMLFRYKYDAMNKLTEIMRSHIGVVNMTIPMKCSSCSYSRETNTEDGIETTLSCEYMKGNLNPDYKCSDWKKNER